MYINAKTAREITLEALAENNPDVMDIMRRVSHLAGLGYTDFIIPTEISNETIKILRGCGYTITKSPDGDLISW